MPSVALRVACCPPPSLFRPHALQILAGAIVVAVSRFRSWLLQGVFGWQEEEPTSFVDAFKNTMAVMGAVAFLQQWMRMRAPAPANVAAPTQELA